jgi:hypothetical protein
MMQIVDRPDTTCCDMFEPSSHPLDLCHYTALTKLTTGAQQYARDA